MGPAETLVICAGLLFAGGLAMALVRAIFDSSFIDWLGRKIYGIPEESPELIAAKSHETRRCNCHLFEDSPFDDMLRPGKEENMSSQELGKSAAEIYKRAKNGKLRD
jgi:hypothetical protein